MSEVNDITQQCVHEWHYMRAEKWVVVVVVVVVGGMYAGLWLVQHVDSPSPPPRTGPTPEWSQPYLCSLHFVTR